MGKKKIWMCILGAYIFIAVFSSYIAPYSAYDISFDAMLSPGKQHILGTDEMGHDIFSLLINGCRITILISIISGFFSTLIGTMLAIFGAIKGGVLDRMILKVSDAMIMVPDIIIIIFFASFSKPSVKNTIYAIVFFSWTKAYKIIRGKVLESIKSDKVIYTIMIRGGMTDIIKKMWTDIRAPIVTMFILQCNKSAIYETTLSYFGIGDPMAKTWGKMIKTALDYEGIFDNNTYLWYLIPPIAMLIIFVVSLSFLTFEKGDGYGR